ncbi:uncharacterized protein [Zea mays]|uniref:uncharacterized protein n=1 Tax=Zea mays TaxID=4577 RepID=UPI0009AAA170|nr:uncharacterized protein LOC103648984 [Zea mays]|eukprot:XP_020404608.1 uncharacterized protein LOC103648984 [Zea mays]
MLSQTMLNTGSFCAMLGSPRRSPSSSCGDETWMSQAMSSSAVSSRARVSGSPDIGLSVKKRRRREWLWKQRAAMPAALWSARSVSAMTRGGALVQLDPRRMPPASCRRSSASFMARDRSSVQSAMRHCQPACCATWSASWMGLASIAFDPSPIVVARGCRRILGEERAVSGQSAGYVDHPPRTEL